VVEQGLKRGERPSSRERGYGEGRYRSGGEKIWRGDEVVANFKRGGGGALCGKMGWWCYLAGRIREAGFPFSFLGGPGGGLV